MTQVQEAISIVWETGRMLLSEFGKQHALTDTEDRSQRDTEMDKKSLKMLCCRLRAKDPKFGIMAEGLKDVAEEIELPLNDHGFYAGDAVHIWVIDPIRGTIPFSRGIPDFCISLALVNGRFPDIAPVPLIGIVYDPVRDEMFYTVRGRGAFCNGRQIHVSQVRTAEEFKARGILSIEHKMIREPEYAPRVTILAQKVGRLRVAGTCGLELAYLAAGRIDAVLKAKQPLYDFIAGLLLVREAGGVVAGFAGLELRMELSYQKITDIFAYNGEKEIASLIYS